MTIAYAVCQFTLKTVFTFSSKLNSRTEPDAPSTDAPTTDDPSTDPPCYEDIVSIDPRYVINSIIVLAKVNNNRVPINGAWGLSGWVRCLSSGGSQVRIL